MTRRMWWLAVAVFAGIALAALWAGSWPRPHELLRNVYQPSFTTAPAPASLLETAAWLRGLGSGPDGDAFFQRLLPGQGGVLWLMLLVTAAVAFDFAHPRSSRNVDLVVTCALAFSFFDIMRLARLRLEPVSFTLIDLVFSIIVVLTVTLIARALWRARGPDGRQLWQPNLRGKALAGLALTLAISNVAVVLIREPDDAGYFTNLGAQRLRERVRMPYGDPMLTGTPGAAYGPVLYVAHIPFQVLIDGRSPNPVSSPQPPMGEAATYVLPPPFATKLCVLTFHLAGLLALWSIGRRLTGQTDVGWALVALYCSSAFVLGVGGDREFIGGITFVSHIAPAAVTLIAFACLPSPAWAGVLLAVGTGAGFYPAFMFPAWSAFFLRNRARLLRFVAGFTIGALVIGGATLALSRPANGRGLVGTILADTFGHHTDPAGYGRSPFGFWGQRQGIRGWLTTPTIGDSGLTTPAYAIFFAMVGLTAVFARRASPGRLALLTAAIAFGASVIKVHSTGTYVTWAYPFLLIGLFANREET